MDSYTGFARLYDEFMEDTPYDEWCLFIKKKLLSYGIDSGLVLDLAAGTGEMTIRLRDAGYDMIAVDNSPEMLDVAKKKDDTGNVLFLCQDMREFELYGTVRAAVCVCDSVNYITDEEDLLTVFKLVNNYLDPGGIFIFDFNTPYKYEEIGESTIADATDDAAFIWDNFYDAETCINEYDITFFTENDAGLYERFDETHIQRGYTLSEMKDAIGRAGLKVLDAFADYTDASPDKETGRITLICMEQGK